MGEILLLVLRTAQLKQVSDLPGAVVHSESIQEVRAEIHVQTLAGSPGACHAERRSEHACIQLHAFNSTLILAAVACPVSWEATGQRRQS